MVAPQRMKSPDKQEVCKKVLTLLKKNYSSTALKPELPVLETLIYAVCLENSALDAAELSYARLLNGFHDLNEVRVSSIYELEHVFAAQSQPEWRALRVKNVLQYVFDTTYSFDLDPLKRKTMELATKQLGKIPALSAFVRSYALQNSLGAHVLPLDDRQHRALIWIGLAAPGDTADHAAENLRPFVRKADAQLFCHLLRCLATDHRFSDWFSPVAAPAADYAATDASVGLTRLEEMLRRGAPPKKDAGRKAHDKPVEKAGASKSAMAGAGNGSTRAQSRRDSRAGSATSEKGKAKKAPARKDQSRAAPKKQK